MGFLNSLGLMHRTKKGWQAPSVRISSSRDRLNWLLSVGERFLVSAPCSRGQTDSDGRGRAFPLPPSSSCPGGRVTEASIWVVGDLLIWAGTWTSETHYRAFPRTPVVSLQNPYHQLGDSGPAAVSLSPIPSLCKTWRPQDTEVILVTGVRQT